MNLAIANLRRRVRRGGSRRALLGAAMAVAVVASGCGGPRTPVAVGVRDVPTDVLLGENIVEAPAPPDVGTRDPGPSFDIPTPPRRFSAPPPVVAPPVDPGPCPEAHPFTAPKHVAGNRTDEPPVAPETYVFRTTGSTTVGDEVSDFPDEAKRTVQNSKRVDDVTMTYQVVEEFGQQKSTKYYTVRRSPTVLTEVPPLPESGEPESGIFLTRETVSSNGQDRDYRWNPPGVKMLPFPVTAGMKWDVAATALNGATLQFRGQIGEEVPNPDYDPDDPDEDDDPTIFVNDKIRVDACGEPIQAWNVQILGRDEVGGKATFTEPGGRSVQYTESHAIATQYGGLAVKFTRNAEGTQGGQALKTVRESIINSVPKLPE